MLPSVRTSTYVSRGHYSTCQPEGIEQDPHYDYHQEVARAAYGDMLHDTERNEMYERALVRAIKKMHDSGRTAEVLDIGTGTGLLSMMAVRHGADRVVACETFVPVAECAERVMEANDVREEITLIKMPSHALNANDIGGRVNILVAELFDTELIGEGAIKSFKHAVEELLEEDSVVIPWRAVIMAQPVSCPFFKDWNTFKEICFEDHHEDPSNHDNCRMCIKPPQISKECSGIPCVHDVQLDSLSLDSFTSISEPQVILRFDFDQEEGELKVEDIKHVSVVAQEDGNVDCVFVWWEITMDKDVHEVLTTAPYWAHPKGVRKQWRDHWMQAVHYPKNVISVKKGEMFNIIVFHDDYNMWLDLYKQGIGELELEELEEEQMDCACQLHVNSGRRRIAYRNDLERNQIYFKALKKVINEESVCLTFSDNSFLPIMAAFLGAKRVFSAQPRTREDFTKSFVESSGVGDKVKVLDYPFSTASYKDFEGEVINTIIGEPYFNNSKVPWEDIRFLYIKDELNKLSEASSAHRELPLMAKKLVVLPVSATIKGVAVQFKDLHKVKNTPVGDCQGFDLAPFDDLVNLSSRLADSLVESHSLWEYPCVALSPEFELLKINFTAPFINTVRQQERDGNIDFNGKGICNGIAMWVDYNFSENLKDVTINNGPISQIVPNQRIQWGPHTQQGVFFLNPPEDVRNPGCRLKFKAVFHQRENKFNFEFDILDKIEIVLH